MQREICYNVIVDYLIWKRLFKSSTESLNSFFPPLIQSNSSCFTTRKLDEIDIIYPSNERKKNAIWFEIETLNWIFAHVEKNYHKNEDFSHSYSDICKASDLVDFFVVLIWFFFLSFAHLVMKASILHGILCVCVFF